MQQVMNTKSVQGMNESLKQMRKRGTRPLYHKVYEHRCRLIEEQEGMGEKSKHEGSASDESSPTF